MKTFLALTKRNIKVFFKDKGMFFVSLITPIILLVLYATFLASVYRDSVASALNGFPVSDELINGIVGGELFSSLLAGQLRHRRVLLEPFNGQRQGERRKKRHDDNARQKVRRSRFVLCRVACLDAHREFRRLRRVLYLHCRHGLVFQFRRRNADYPRRNFAHCVRHRDFIRHQRVSVLAGSGFGCGHNCVGRLRLRLRRVYAHFQLRHGLAKRAHVSARNLRHIAHSHARAERGNEGARGTGAPVELIDGLKSGLDCTLEFFGHTVSVGAMYGVLIGSTVLFIGAYILINILKKPR